MPRWSLRQRQPEPRTPLTGRPAPPVTGVSPTGEDRSLCFDSGRTVVAFLTSGCRECAVVWNALACLPAGGPRRGGLVVVTPGPGTESRRRVAELAVGVDEVVMGDAAWFAWGVPGAPWGAVVEDGTVTAEGVVRSSDELVALVGR